MPVTQPDDDAAARFSLLDLDADPPHPYVPDAEEVDRFSLLELDEGIPAFPEYVVKIRRPGSDETETLVMATLALGREASTDEYRDACYRRGRRLATSTEYARFHETYPETVGKPIVIPGPSREGADLWSAEHSLLTVYL